MDLSVVRTALALGFVGAAAYGQTGAAGFASAVKPVLERSCFGCHNEQMASGGLNLKSLAAAGPVAANRDDWETVLRRLKAGEMPPPPMAKPAGLPAMVGYLEQEFAALDRNAKPDPGRITARHLNRTEYRNTIRDLLGVDFQTAHEFPVDDSGDGFDNLGDVLSVSPLLTEKYLAAADRISARALGLVKYPAKPIASSYADDEHYSEVVGFTGNAGSAHRVGNSFIEVTHRVDYEGVYTIQAGLAGQRGADGKPVMMGFWMDGRLLHSEEVTTTPPKTVYFGAYEKKEFQVTLPEGVHTFRLGFMNDEAGARMPKDKAFNLRLNKYPQLIGFLGPEGAPPPPSGRARILICDPNSGDACVARILANLAHRAYRRPVTAAEASALMALYASARKEGLDTDHGLQVAVQAILCSPDFLFRIERDDPKSAAAVHRISAVELASRLSYFLWSSMPDDDLLGLAESGRLSDPAVLDAQIKRMLADPKSRALSENFAGQWLELRNLESMKPDPDKFPEWSAELKDAMRTETQMLFDAILRENRPVSEFLTARYTFLNETLAKFYGIEGVTGPEFRRVDLTTAQRGGLLGQASVMAVSSYPSRTSVVLRGKYLLDNILGSPPPPPPAMVPSLDEDAIGASLSLRQQMEKHRSDPSCASCHSKMDPLGFALENYDVIGKWRTMDGKFPVDASGTLPDGSKFNGPAELREALSKKLPQFANCVAEKMMMFALGRGIRPFDRRTIDQITRDWEKDGYRFQSLIYAIAHGVPFQSRRGEVPGEVAQR